MYLQAYLKQIILQEYMHTVKDKSRHTPVYVKFILTKIVQSFLQLRMLEGESEFEKI